MTRKISFGVAKIAAGKADRLALGNLESRRDWGHAREYVTAMWAMLQQDRPDDYVIATGVVHSVEDFARLAFACVGLDYRNHVVTDERFHRPAEVDFLMGDASKARAVLGWSSSTTFEQLVAEMVAADCEAVGVRTASQQAVNTG